MEEERLSISVTAIIFVTGLYSCIHSGLYFTISIYPLAGLWILGVAIFLTWTSLCTRSVSQKITSRSLYDFVAIPLTMAIILIVHIIAGPLSMQSSWDELLRVIYYCCFAVGLSIAVRTIRGRKWLEISWHLLGMTLTLSALASVYGLMQIPYTVMRSSNVAVAASGARLGGILQYPNTYAVVMSVFLLERLMYISHTSSIEHGVRRWFSHACLTFPYAACLLLTESRGAWICTVVGWLVGCLLLPREVRYRFVLLSAIFASGAGLLFRQLSDVQLAPSTRSGVLWFMILGLLCLLASFIVTRLSSQMTRRIVIGAFIIVGMSVVAGMLSQYIGWSSGSTRDGPFVRDSLSTITARGLMYRDAWSLFQRAPWFGQGGDTWRMSFRSVQSQPYVGNEVHSGYIDLMLDVGLVGGIIVIGLLGQTVGRLMVNRSKLLPSFIALLLHCTIDFDMSFGIIWMLILWMMAVGVAIPNEAQQETTYVKETYKFKHVHIVKRVGASLISISLLYLCITEARFAESQKIYRIAMIDTTNPVRSSESLKRALVLNPYLTTARITLANRMEPDQARSLLKQGLSYDPGHPDLWWSLGLAMAKDGDPAAMKVLERALLLDRFDKGKYRVGIREMLQQSVELRVEGQVEQSQQVARIGLKIYESYAQWIDYVRNIANSRNDRAFEWSVDTDRWGEELVKLATLQRSGEKLDIGLHDQLPTVKQVLH